MTVKIIPGDAIKEMAKLLGLSPSTINYHINILIGREFVRTEKSGKWTKYYAVAQTEISEPSENT